MWVRVTGDFDWRQPGFTVAYRAGWTGNVPSAAGEAAITAGRAVRLRKTSKDEEPVEWLSDPQPGNSESA